MALLALVAAGCAKQLAEPELRPRRPDVIARPVPREAPREAPRPRPLPQGFVIAVPEGARDDIAAELAKRTGFALVVGPGGSALEQQPLAFYAEIHPSARRDAVERIDITTANVDAGLASRLRTLYELIRDAHLRGYPGAPRVDMRVEPGEAGARTTRTLRLEVPRVARTDAREPYLEILADFLTQAATLPAGR